MALADRNDTDGTLPGLRAVAPPRAALVAPAVKYQTLMELGRGGSAVVSAALARGIGGFSKLVVLKTVKEELCAHPDAVRTSLNEARLAARMSHPNVVQVYEVYQERGIPVIVMEYLDGLSLSRVVRQGYHPGGQTLRMMLTILCKVLEGIRYAHGLSDFDGKPLGIVHRDISPQNVMLTYDGQVKLVDFGTAKLMAGAEEPLSGMFRGKLGYMPPEQVCGEQIDGRADLFAVGVMLWEAVAGKRLWGELHHAGIIRRLMGHDIPRLAEAAPEADPELVRICEHALAPVREQRYPDAAAFSRDLEGYLDTLGGSVSTLTLGEMVQRSCPDLKRAREEALRAALAEIEDWQFEEQPQPAATLLPLDSSLAATPLSERRGRPARRVGWAALLLACLLGGMVLARQSGWRAQAPAAAPTARAELAATITLAAPSGAVRAPLVTPLAVPPPLAEQAVPAPAARNVPPLAAAAAVATGADAPAPQPARVQKTSKRARRAAARAPRQPAPRRKAAQPIASIAVSCDPPYVIDAHGIKRFRRACLASGE